jgi:hypothetical protein
MLLDGSAAAAERDAQRRGANIDPNATETQSPRPLEQKLALPARNDGIVLIVAADPKPDEVRASFNSNSTEMNTNTCRPELAHFFEVERRVV